MGIDQNIGFLRHHWRDFETVIFRKVGLDGMDVIKLGQSGLPPRVILRSLLVMFLVNVLIVLGFYLAGPDLVDARTRIFAISSILFFHLILSLAIVTIAAGRIRLGCNITIGGASVLIGSVILLTGGLGKSVALPILMAIPCFYYCLLSVRAGLIAAVAAPLSIWLVELAIGFSAVPIPDMTSQSSAAFNQLMVAGGTYIMLTLCVAGLVRANETLNARLRTEHQKLEHLASIDPLTGIANRRVFDLELDALLALNSPAGRRVGLILVDLNGFKPINDHYGHPVGDDVLKLVADRLVNASPRPHLIARLGGDEFAAIVSHPLNPEQLDDLVQTFQKVVEAPMKIAGITLTVGIAAGFAISPDDGLAAGPLVRAADAALYHNKRGTLLKGPWAEEYKKSLVDPVGQRRRHA